MIPFVCGALMALSLTFVFANTGVQADDLMSAPEQEGSPTTIDVKNFIGTLVVIRGDEILWELDKGEIDAGQLNIRKSDTGLRFDGGFSEGPDRCRSDNGALKVAIDSGEFFPISQFPRLMVTIPEGASLDIDVLGGRGKIGDVGELDLTLRGCGSIDFGDVEEMLSVRLTGSGEIAGGSAGNAVISLSGSGDVSTGRISGTLEADLSGSGDISIASAGGPITARLQGSGDIDIAEGAVTNFDADLQGSGDIRFDGSADTVKVLLKGSGDVYVARSTGSPSVVQSGSGDVRIGNRRHGNN